MNSDPHSEELSNRKKDHIELAFESQVHRQDSDRFYYEPLLSGHPRDQDLSTNFLRKELKAPIWVSSMTGGTQHARSINYNLAKVCNEYGLGFGLGSCRSLLYDNTYLQDFDVRNIIGDSLPLYANLGIAQVEELVLVKKYHILKELIEKLRADGLIIHVNPSQEWLQPEGDRFRHAPIDIIKQVLEKVSFPIIVKEVGQGMGYNSLKALLQLPIQAIEFGAHGGTNFAMLELLRGNKEKLEQFEPLVYVGHSAEQMVEWCNRINNELDDLVQCREIIISGGIRSFLDGYYLINKLQLNCVYGQAAPFLKYAQQGYEELSQFVAYQIEGLQYANAFLRTKD